jgi:hypothetical protein
VGRMDGQAAMVGPLTTGGYSIALPFADRSKFGLRIRIAVRCAFASATGSVGDQADISVTAAVRFFCT